MKFKKGCWSVFDDKTGIKTYREKEHCDYAYNAQIKAYEMGIAPPVIKRIDDFSYQTVIADVSFIQENLRHFDDSGKDIYYHNLFPDLHEKLCELFKDKPKTRAKYLSDMVARNLGIWEGKVVMIDFY